MFYKKLHYNVTKKAENIRLALEFLLEYNWKKGCVYDFPSFLLNFCSSED